jgi:hypothetical protein
MGLEGLWKKCKTIHSNRRSKIDRAFVSYAGLCRNPSLSKQPLSQCHVVEGYITQELGNIERFRHPARARSGAAASYSFRHGNY